MDNKEKYNIFALSFKNANRMLTDKNYQDVPFYGEPKQNEELEAIRDEIVNNIISKQNNSNIVSQDFPNKENAHDSSNKKFVKGGTITSSATSDLPIYEVATRLLGLSREVTKNMSRDMKMLYGKMLIENVMDFIIQINDINIHTYKIMHMKDGFKILSKIKLIKQIMFKLKLISEKRRKLFDDLIQNTYKQLHGWYKNELKGSRGERNFKYLNRKLDDGCLSSEEYDTLRVLETKLKKKN